MSKKIVKHIPGHVGSFKDDIGGIAVSVFSRSKICGQCRLKWGKIQLNFRHLIRLNSSKVTLMKQCFISNLT